MAISGIKRKRVSKKSKLSWRKHTKVQDIEEFLDEQREDERLGVSLETQTNEQLFVVDVKPQESIVLTRQQRKLRASRPLKGFSALQPHTNVPDPIKKRNRVRTPTERKSALVIKKEFEEKERGLLKSKEKNAINERRLDEIRREKEEKRGEFSNDIWSSKKVLDIEKDPWIEDVTKVHNLRNIGIPVKNTVKGLNQKKSVLPAVEVPHPGMSYNPSFKDHQDLLKIVADKEIKIIKEEKHLARVTRGMFRKVTEKQKQGEWMAEMSQGIPPKNKQNDQEMKEEEDENLDRISINPPVKNKKKTLKQKRKHREQLDLAKQRKTVKMEKKKIGDIHKLKVIQKNIQDIEVKQEKLRKMRKIREEKKKLEPKVLSSTKFEDPGPEFQMGQDISGNLRGLKKEGSLLSDRFKSLQKRNILEPSKIAHKKKPKVKKYTRPGYKDDWEKTIARSTVSKK